MKKNVWKKVMVLALGLAMCFSLNISAFAAETSNFITTDNPSIEPYAISGSNEGTGNSGKFYINSPASSVFGHADFTVSGTDEEVYVQLWAGDRNITYAGGAGFVTVPANSTMRITFLNAPSGEYRVEFQVNGDSTATVKCTLGDWW